MTLKSDAKFETLYFDVYFCHLHIKFQPKKYRTIIAGKQLTLENDPNFEEKLTFCLKNDARNLVKFNASIEKS